MAAAVNSMIVDPCSVTYILNSRRHSLSTRTDTTVVSEISVLGLDDLMSPPRRCRGELLCLALWIILVPFEGYYPDATLFEERLTDIPYNVCVLVRERLIGAVAGYDL